MFRGETKPMKGFWSKKSAHTSSKTKSGPRHQQIQKGPPQQKKTLNIVDPKTSTQIHTGKHFVDHINKQTPQMDNNYLPL